MILAGEAARTLSVASERCSPCGALKGTAVLRGVARWLRDFLKAPIVYLRSWLPFDTGEIEMTRSALITGITGQDGSYLAEFLLAKGYAVYGLVRRSSTINFERLKHLQDQIELLPGDLLDQNSLISALKHSNPGEVYNLASQSFVPTS